MDYRIAVVVGSLRRESFNAQLAKCLVNMAPADFKLETVRIDDLPLYNQDEESNPPESVKRLKAQILDAYAVIFVTPEYNRSVPGVLKNAIDHASRPYGHSVWAGKPAGVIGVSVGALGTSMAQQHLRNMLAYLDMPTLGQPEAFIQNKPGLFTPDGKVGIDSTREFLQKWMNRYCEFVRLHVKGG